ncbi:thiamine pyrophosphate-binding protein [Marinobacter sp. BSs20148]|jgi:acetolactate synthase-1/2/3 large subunit|uniref:thiamine pyrophosphate-binding protein n=1 Tax=Marinobacter sp. BSs20148 TaxID=490759 RepID=UPI00027768A0|nr:thiamine pyrophosphate-dependent enzyme [Marinobacter sp. BSs20148]AFP30256.1 Acetolactate synthase large subunit [Marinobacter sp. BSs20148]
MSAENGSKYKKYQSDVIVDLLHEYEFPYIAMNPGASFRGLHDSIINYGGNKPEMLLCQHEEIAVQIAHGYARATGKPMGVILHNLVGLLHAQMAIYYANLDRAPIFIMGATGPMDEGKRRPHIDWSHTALVQGEAVRNYTKWDYQPTAIEGVPESFMRAYSTMVTEPKGPIYMCYDAWLQEKPLDENLKLGMPPAGMSKSPARMGADPVILEQMVDKLLAAQNPIIMAEYTGRHEDGFDNLVALAETLGVPVWDINDSLCFPNRHPLCASMDQEVMRKADLILGIDVRDWEKPTAHLDSTNRIVTSLVSEKCEWMEVGFGEIGMSSWAMDYGRYQPKVLSALGDPALVMPEMTRIGQQRLDADGNLAKRIQDRKEALGQRHDEVWAQWQEDARADWDSEPLALARFASEVWEVIQHEDWVCATGTLHNWTRKIWDYDKPYRHAGRSLGTATQIGMSIGVGLAYKNTDKVVVALQPDGDLMFDAGALWTAAKHEIPLLILMFNNRAYFNDWEHQIRMAKLRGTDEAKAHIGMDLFGPDPDFATIAQGMGCYGEGPITKPADVGPAIRRALAEVKKGRPALVDIITLHR